MKQIHLLAIGFVSAISAVPAMASDDSFHALDQMSMKPAAMTDDGLAATEGGSTLPTIKPVNVNVAVQTIVQPVNVVQLNIAAGIFGARPTQGNNLGITLSAGTSANLQH